MKVQFFLCIMSVSLFSSFVWASNQINVAIGTSVPAAAENLLLPSGPSRAAGGERFIVKFANAKMISSIKLSAYSNARNGRVLIRNAVANQGKTKIALEGLYQFGKASAGNPTNTGGKNMLTDSSFVEVLPAQAFTQIEITMEGYTNDDSSLLIQIVSTETLPLDDFLITRTGPQKKEFVGGLIDESLYASFSLSQVQRLIKQAKSPNSTDLVDKNFVCSNYSRMNPTQLDFKQRTFQLSADGKLQSEGDLEGPTQSWNQTTSGQVRTIKKFNGCGKYVVSQVLRQIGSGSLVSEVVTHLEDYVRLCVNAGYDENAIRSVSANTTFASIIDPANVVMSYEFCRAQD